ncbi:hypothetical protein V6N12_046862 [Hibiscus sabdariffa]|uniref:Uncharacterized protein n=1 Tax=Hibiscus sabdariffa TaxID=183260 RepID=A0ABR2AL21_9ROSI
MDGKVLTCCVSTPDPARSMAPAYTMDQHEVKCYACSNHVSKATDAKVVNLNHKITILIHVSFECCEGSPQAPMVSEFSQMMPICDQMALQVALYEGLESKD